jgi:RNA polymerase sigma-70 factor (ECF subfamily)
MTDPIPPRRYSRSFATTRWGVVRAAAGEGESAQSALESLCKDYWEPVHTHVLYRVSDTHLAEDLTQEFFSKFLSQGWFLRPREERGKFRTFLLTVLRRFLKDELQRTRAWKRGGRTVTMSLDDLPEIAANDPTNSTHFDRAWAKTLLHRAFVALRKESDGERFDHLFPFLQREPDRGEYQTLTDRFGMTPNTIAAAVSRLRRRLRDLLREEIRQTLDESEDVDEEMRHLLHLLAA